MSSIVGCFFCYKSPSIIESSDLSISIKSPNINTIPSNSITNPQLLPILSHSPAIPNQQHCESSLNNINNEHKASINLDDPSPIRSASKLSIITFSNVRIKDSYKSIPDLDTEIITGKELKLSGELFWNKDIIIDRFGLKAGKRKKRDGVTYFGISEALDSHDRAYNDFILNLPQSIIGNAINSRDTNANGNCDQIHSLFEIHYIKNEEEYAMKALTKSPPIIMYQIEYSYTLPMNKRLEFLIGKVTVFLTTSILCSSRQSLENKNQIELIIISPCNDDQNKTYTFEEKELPITIGRTNSKINIKNTSISKSHAMIYYSEESQCFIFQDKESTNGSFIVLNERDELKMKGEMKMNINELKFTITEIKE